MGPFEEPDAIEFFQYATSSLVIGQEGHAGAEEHHEAS